MIPVLHRDCKIPLQLRRVQYIDFRTDYGSGLAALLKTLGVEEPALRPAAERHQQAAVGSPESINALRPLAATVAAAEEEMTLLPPSGAAPGKADAPLHRKLEGHSQWIKRVALSPDGTLLAAGGQVIISLPQLWLWQVPEGKIQLKLLRYHTNSINGLAFSPDGTLLASASDDSAHLWQVSEGSHLYQVKGGESVAFSPDGSLLASGSADGLTRIWRYGDWKLLRTLGQDDGKVSSLLFSAQGDWLASGGKSKVRLWDRSDWDTVTVLNGATS